MKITKNETSVEMKKQKLEVETFEQGILRLIEFLE